MRIRRFAAVLSVVLALVSVPAGAFEEDDPELYPLHSQPFSGSTWVAYRVTVPSDSYVWLHSQESGSQATFGAMSGWLLDANGDALHSYPYGHSRSTQYARVMVDGPAPVGHVDESITPSAAGMGPDAFYHFESAGEFTILSIGSSNASEWGGTIALEGTEGVALLSSSIGSAELITEEEFDDMAVNVSVNGTRVRRRGDAYPSITRSITSQLYGRFEGNARLSHTGPDGGAEGYREYVFSGTAPGDYRFQMDTVSTTTSGGTRFDPGRTYVLIADVTLPT